MEWVIFDDISGTKMKALSGWESLLDLIINPPLVAEKRDCKLLKLCSFGSSRSPKKSLRHDANVTSVYGIEGDYDGGVISINKAHEILTAFGIKSILHTTPSHTEDFPRWRVLAPLSKAHGPEDRKRFITLLDAFFGGILAPESFVLSQTFFFGAVEGRDYQVRKIDGRCIDEVWR